jgi:mRNA interferase RelE/StbE
VARYSIRIKKTALKELESVASKADRQRIVRRISALADDPRPAGCQKFSGRDLYRARQGNYRILYSIKAGELVVFVIRIRHRKDIYRRQ